MYIIEAHAQSQILFVESDSVIKNQKYSTGVHYGRMIWKIGVFSKTTHVATRSIQF